MLCLRGGSFGVTGLAGLYLRGGRVSGVGLALSVADDAGARDDFNIFQVTRRGRLGGSWGSESGPARTEPSGTE